MKLNFVYFVICVYQSDSVWYVLPTGFHYVEILSIDGLKLIKFLIRKTKFNAYFSIV